MRSCDRGALTGGRGPLTLKASLPVARAGRPGKPCSRFGFAAASGFQEPVSNLINERIALTLVISRYFLIFTCAVFIPVGIIVSAVKQYSLTDYTVTLHGFLGGWRRATCYARCC